MKNIKDELQNIIIGNGQDGYTSKLKKVQNFLRANVQTGAGSKEQKYLKGKEKSLLIDFANKEDLMFPFEIPEEFFISEGAEQRVYRYDNHSIIKFNSGIFYEYWLDYFNSLLVHNYFFNSTLYEFLGFKIQGNEIYAIVKQDFIIATDTTDLNELRSFLEFNSFIHVRNNDYLNPELGIIFEDLHDENVLCRNGLLYFIDTVFYLNSNFYID